MEHIMKSSLKRILPILLAILVLCSVVWYLFVYDRVFTRDLLLWQARLCENNNRHSLAAWFYQQAYSQSDDNQEVAIELAEQFKAIGNFTKAEATLSGAIANDPSAELYIALSKTYVEQNKLLDAVNMLENITDPELKAQLEALRPALPTASVAPGYYSQYITVDITAESGTLYVSQDNEYPSVTEDPYSGSISLPGGETKIFAISVGENGLVSPLAVFGYTIAGVVEGITLEDAVLDACIREALGFTADQALLTSDLWTITSLTVPQDAGDYSELRYLTGLQTLTMHDCNVSDLQFLSAMPQLTELYISGISLSSADISIISGLSNLTKLELSGCSLSSIEGLSALRNLTRLDLSENTIRDISSLSFMSELLELDLSNNAITSLNAISALPKLVWLNLSGNSLSSLVPLSGNASLLWLDVSNNSIATLDGLHNMTQLTNLFAGYNQLTDVSPLTQNASLLELDVSNNSLTNISALSALTQLQALNFSHNQVTALPEFRMDCQLIRIDGSYNQLGTLAPLGGLSMLNHVILDYNNIMWVDPLAKCYNLVRLDIFGNPVSDVSKLTDMGVIVNYSPDV